MFLSMIFLVQVTKARSNDKDARAKYNECNKIVKRLAFEKAIAVEDNTKSVSESINLDTMCRLHQHYHNTHLIFFLFQ